MRKWKEKFLYLHQINHITLSVSQAKIFLQESANKLIWIKVFILLPVGSQYPRRSVSIMSWSTKRRMFHCWFQLAAFSPRADFSKECITLLCVCVSMCVCGWVEGARSSIQEHPGSILGPSPEGQSEQQTVTPWTSFWLCERWAASLFSTSSPSSQAHSALLQTRKGKEIRLTLSQARGVLCIKEGRQNSSYSQIPASFVVLPFRRSFKAKLGVAD